MLHGEYRCRNKQGALLALAYTFEGGAQRYLGFSEAYVAAEQAVHRHVPLHITLYFVNAAQLVLCLVIFKPALKIVL